MTTSPPRRGQPPNWADMSFRSLLEAAPDAMLVVDRAGEIVVTNLQAQKLYGYSREHLIGSVVESLIPARLRDRHRQHRENFFANPEKQAMQVLEIFAVRSDASEIPVDVSLSRLTIGSETFAISAIRDATDRHRIEELKRAEAVLRETRESEQRFRLVADTAPVLIWMSETDKLCTYFNKPWLDFTGRSLDSELGNGWAEGVHPEDLRRCMDTYTQAFDRREEFRMEYRLRRHDGEYRWVLDIGVPRFNQDRSFVGYIGIGVDVTERKVAEERLREYEKVVEGSEEMIAVVDREYRYLIANRKFLNFRNMTKEQVVGRLAHEVLNKGVFEAVVKEKLDECFRGKVVRYEMKYTYPELGERDVFISNFPIEGATGIDRVACILQDITDRKRTEEALRESEERFRLAAQAGKMYAYEWDVATDKVVRSEEYVDVLGYSHQAKQLTRQQLLASIHPEDRALFVGSADQLTPQNPTTQVNYRVLRPDGSVIWLEKSARGFFDEQGKLLRVIGMVANITERKRTEETLSQSEARLRLAAQAGKMYAFEWDVATDVMVRSSEYVNVLGASEPRTLTHQQAMEKVHPDDREKLVAAVDRHSLENPTVDVAYRVLLPGKSPIWVKSSGRAFFDGEGRMLRVIGMVADVTDQKLAEEALRSSEERLRLAQKAARIGTFERNLRTGVNIWTPEMESMYGLPPGGFGQTRTAFENLVHPDDRAEVMKLVDQALKTGQPTHGEWRVVWPDESVHWIAGRWQVLMEESGEPSRVVGVDMDITERKLGEAALANVSRRLLEAQEQERTRIARELHDDFSQRLALLAVELDELRQNPPILPEIRRRMGGLYKQVSEIATDIQTLSHELHSSKLEYLGIAAAMRGFCQEFSAQQDVEIDLRSHDLPSSLSPDISLCLFRVLQEAVHNSAKHSGVRHVEVRLWGTSDEIHLAISDSGAGFDSEAAKKGRGLGLISMEERLKLLKGTLSIESLPKRGTSIHARVPLSSGRDSMRAAG